MSGWGSACLILSLCLISPGQFPAVIRPAPSTWKSKPLQERNTIREGGGKSLISALLSHANNEPRQHYEEPRALVAEGGWMGKQGGARVARSCVTRESISSARLLFLSAGLGNED